MEYLLVKPTLELIKTTQGGLLFDKSKGKHLLITPTEAVILSLCDGSRTVDEVIDYVSSLYNEPKEKCANDVKKFVSSASGNVLISIGRQVSISSDFPSPHIFEEIEIEDVLVPEKIITLGISPTYDCSLRCEYCFAQSDGNCNTGKSLEIQIAKKVLKDAAHMGAIRLDVSGGDPINYKYLPELIRESIELGYQDITISTKGVSLTRDLVHRLRMSGLDKIQMSIDTLNPDLYDSTVGFKGMYERMIRGWYNLRREGFRIVNRATVTGRTIEYVKDMLKKTYDMGIMNTRAIGVLHYGRGENNMMPPLKEMAELRKDVAILSKEYPDSKWIVGDVRFGDPYPCEGTISRIWVHPDGRVSLCDVAGAYLDSYPVFVYGNIHKDKLSNIWHKKISPIFRTVRDQSCSSCPISISCRGGCPLFAATYYGDATRAIPTCNLRSQDRVDVGE